MVWPIANSRVNGKANADGKANGKANGRANKYQKMQLIEQIAEIEMGFFSVGVHEKNLVLNIYIH